MHPNFIILNVVALYCNNNVNSGLGIGRDLVGTWSGLGREIQILVPWLLVHLYEDVKCRPGYKRVPENTSP